MSCEIWSLSRELESVVSSSVDISLDNEMRLVSSTTNEYQQKDAQNVACKVDNNKVFDKNKKNV